MPLVREPDGTRRRRMLLHQARPLVGLRRMADPGGGQAQDIAPGPQWQVPDPRRRLPPVRNVAVYPMEVHFMIWLSDCSALSFDSIGRAQPTVSPPGSGAPILGWFVEPKARVRMVCASDILTRAFGDRDAVAPQALRQGIQPQGSPLLRRLAWPRHLLKLRYD